MGDRYEVTVDNQRYRKEAIPLEHDIDDEKYNKRHFDETSHLKLASDSERRKKILSKCCDTHLCDTDESSHQDSPSQYYVDSEHAVVERRLSESASPNDFELGRGSFDGRRHNSTACTDVQNDTVEKTSFDNSSYSADVDDDDDVTERPVNDARHFIKRENAMFRRRPLDESTYCTTYCTNVSSDIVESSLVNNTTSCFEHDNEAFERRPSDSAEQCDINVENAGSRHIDSTTSPDNFHLYNGHHNYAFEGRPLKNGSYGIEADASTFEREELDGRIYYELDLDSGAIVEWRDSSGSIHSSDTDSLEPRGSSSRLTFRGISSECLICFEKKTSVRRRSCCKFPVCRLCLETYYAMKVSMASVQVQCIGDGCSKYVSQAEMMSYLTEDMQDRYMQHLVDANRDPHRKTCPRCSHITDVDPQTLREQGNRKYGLRCVCTVCNLVWCFKCQAPWHEPVSCRQYQHGDRQFKAWTKQQLEGQANAQKCPKCKVYIQRNGGCDHMTCSKCLTDFCYQCGEKYRKMKFVGDHRSPYSILGCKFRYKPNSPVKRRLIRGSIFGGKLLAAPIVGSLALGAGAVVVGLGLVALPFYGGYRLHKMVKQKKRDKEEKAMRNTWRDFWVTELEEDPDMADIAQYFGQARESSSISTFQDFHNFEFDSEFDEVLTNHYGDDSDEFNAGVYSSAVNEEPEESGEHQNNLSHLQQSVHEVSSEADAFDVKATKDLDDTGALNSDRLNLSADSKVLDGSFDKAESAATAKNGVGIPRRFCRTYFIESTGLGMNKIAGSNLNGKQRNLGSTQDVVKTKDEFVETCDQVTRL